jgi:hypothetical protein
MRRAWAGLLLGVGVLGLVGWVRAGGGAEVTLDGLKSAAPAAWQREKVPAKLGKLRVAQFRLPKADRDPEDAELVIFFFGRGSGGGTEDNVKRWKGMFDPPKGKTIEEVSKVEKKKVGNVSVVVVDVHGTFKSRFPPNDPNAKVTRKENFRQINVIFDSENGPYFFRLTGPADTIAQHKKGFDDWLKNFK